MSDLDDAYLEQLSDRDVAALLAAVRAGGLPQRPPGGSEPTRLDVLAARSLLRRRGVTPVLSAPEVAAGVLAPGAPGEPLAMTSPFLLFAVAVHATTASLAGSSYLSEWTGPGRTTPVFDAPRLSAFLADPWRRLFLAELLASYTKVASGSVLVATRRGVRRQRFSELDPVRMAGLLETLPHPERPGILRRLGDLALFLTGVFPDHVARRGFGPIEEGRLQRAGAPLPGAAGDGAGDADRPPGSDAAVPARTSLAARFAGDGGAVGLLDELGRRWYGSAFALLPRPVPARVAVIGEMPERFDEARRVVNHLAERYLLASRDRLFGRGG